MTPQAAGEAPEQRRSVASGPPSRGPVAEGGSRCAGGRWVPAYLDVPAQRPGWGRARNRGPSDGAWRALPVKLPERSPAMRTRASADGLRRRFKKEWPRNSHWPLRDLIRNRIECKCFNSPSIQYTPTLYLFPSGSGGPGQRKTIFAPPECVSTPEEPVLSHGILIVGNSAGDFLRLHVDVFGCIIVPTHKAEHQPVDTQFSL